MAYPKPLLSIVIPAYNEERRLPQTLEQVFTFLKQQSYQAEVIVVENGSSDKTFAIAQQFAGQFNNLHVIQEPLRGKGQASRRGALAGEPAGCVS